MVNFLNLEYIFLWIYNALISLDPAALVNWIVQNILVPIRPYAAIITLAMIAWIIYSTFRFNKIEKKELEKFNVKKEPEPTIESQSDLAAKWAEVEKNINSVNPSDWKVAIIDADVLLGMILSRQGYSGDTIGDQLKAVNPSDMLTLQHAWDAHKVRNDIAHGAVDFQLNDRQAKATIELYKKVFEEFYYI